MQTMGAFEAKTHFSKLLEELEKGEEVIITKHGHPVAKMVPMVKHDKDRIRQTIERLKILGQEHSLGGLNWKTLRDEGRRG